MAIKYMIIPKLVLVGFSLCLNFQVLQAAGPPKSTPVLLEKGKASFTTNCLLCHGEKGDGNGPAGAVMNPKPRNFATDKFRQGDKPQQIFNSITKGVKDTSMTAFGHLPEEERWALVYHVLELKKQKVK